MEQNQALEQMFAQQMAENPQYQAMYSLMQQMKTNRESAGEAGQSPVSELDACKARLAKASAKIRQLAQQVEELTEELSDADRFEEDLANALGACSFCWGEDHACRACRGKGKPGAFEPDPALFEQFVLPVLQRRQVSLQ